MTFKFAGKIHKLLMPHLTAAYAPVMLGNREIAFPRPYAVFRPYYHI